MTPLVVILSFMVFTTSGQNNGRIVGGVPVPIEAFPHQAAIVQNTNFVCGASIIAPQWLITAAHCLSPYYNPVRDLRLRVGTSTYVAGGQRLTINRTAIHPQYVRKTFQNDVAVIRVNELIVYSPSAQAIRMAAVTPPDGTPLWVTGWGHEGTGGTFSPILRGVQVDIVNWSQCHNQYTSINVTLASICAARPGADACQGDSGGPLSANGVLYGVVSYGKGCASEEYPGVYTNVANGDIATFVTNATGIAALGV